MHIVIDGSYCESKHESVSCGIILADEIGFYEEKRYETKHVEASSTLSEWFAFEKALDEIALNQFEDETRTITIYTDYKDIVTFMNQNKLCLSVDDIPIKNMYLKKYIYRINNKYHKLKLLFRHHKKNIQVKFQHVKFEEQPEFIIRLHKKAHNLAKNDGSAKKEHNSVQIPFRAIDLRISLRTIEPGIRKWVIVENGEPLYVGKLQKIIRSYERERYNLSFLMEHNKLNLDKSTKRLLVKHVPSLVA